MTEPNGYRAHVLEMVRDLKDEVKETKKAQTKLAVDVAYMKSKQEITDKILYGALITALGYVVSQLMGII
jgi:hypothetical protein